MTIVMLIHVTSKICPFIYLYLDGIRVLATCFRHFFRRTIALNLSASGGFVPWPRDQRLCPWIPLGTLPQTQLLCSRYGAPCQPPLSRLRSYHYHGIVLHIYADIHSSKTKGN